MDFQIPNTNLLKNIKFQAPNLMVSGVPPEADQGSGVRCQEKEIQKLNTEISILPEH
jgi:hypothetical protein